MNTYLKYKPVWFKILVMGSLMFGVSVVLGLISFTIAAKMSGFALQDMLSPDFNNPKMMQLQKWLLPLNSGVATFLIPSLLYAYFADPQPGRFLRANTRPASLYWILAAIIVVVAIPSAFWLGELNKTLDLSHAYPAFDKWMKESEDLSNKMIEKIIGKNQQVSDLFVNLFLLAFVPALSEELFFRGLILKGLVRYMRNVWGAVILSAIIFSAFHFQFLTFLTRLEMGIILGVIFWYSGSLWTSILAHFVFNGIQVVVAFWKPDMQDPPPSMISAGMVGFSFLAVIALIVIMRDRSTLRVAEVFDDEEEEDDGIVI